jgi:hypothetical protein
MAGTMPSSQTKPHRRVIYLIFEVIRILIFVRLVLKVSAICTHNYLSSYCRARTCACG